MLDPEPDLIDYHCHLDLYPDFEAQFQDCTARRIAALAVTTTPRAWPRNQELASGSAFIRVALGLHPQLVARHGEELPLFERYLDSTRYVGEIGLDAGPAHYASYAQQKQVFEKIVRLCAEADGKILSIHSVRAARDVLRFVERYLTGTDNRVVLHWFSGSVAEARLAAELGCYFSINSEMLKRPAALAWLRQLPRERLLTETDGPFTKQEARPTVPADVADTMRRLACLLEVPTEDCRKLLWKNLVHLESRSRDRSG